MPDGFTSRELDSVIRMLPSKTAPGPHEVESLLLKHLGKIGRSGLLGLLNKSWQTGYVPAAWRVVTLIGIPKPADPTSLKPISLSSIVNRVTERIVNLKLAFLMESNSSPSQAGFRTQRGTQEHIFALAQRVHDSFNRRRKCAAIFVDFSAAYDRVDIPALLLKLQKMGCSSSLYKWLASYLQDRKAHGRHRSSIGRVLDCGLPQGSTLSPSL